MNQPSGTRQLRPAASRGRLNLAAVTGVLTGTVLLAGAAFLLSYARFHEMALTAGVSPSLATLYPLMFDTALVIACVAALALRGAAWWMRGFALLSVTILLAAVAVAEAVHSAGISLPYGPTAAAFAALPWALFLIGFCLGLLVLRYLRTARAVARADDAGTPRESVRKQDAPVLSVFQREAPQRLWSTESAAADAGIAPAESTPASPNLGQHPTVTPDAVSSPASEHHHGQAHAHYHHRADHSDSS
jgi:Protein of unknown function (DUF2637)